jgi:hypothetical protein
MLYARRSRTTARCLAALSLARASFCRLLSAAGNQISNKMQHWTCTEFTVEIKQCDADDLVLHHARRSILVSLLPTAPAHGIPCHGLNFIFFKLFKKNTTQTLPNRDQK